MDFYVNQWDDGNDFLYLDVHVCVCVSRSIYVIHLVGTPFILCTFFEFRLKVLLLFFFKFEVGEWEERQDFCVLNFMSNA